MSDTLHRLWWIAVVRGALLIALGLLLLIDPLSTVTALVWLFGAFAVLDGLLALAQGIAYRHDPAARWRFVQGLVGIAFGVLLMVWPAPTATVVFYVLAFWVMLIGLVAIVGAFVLHHAGDPGWTFALTFGLIGFLIGLVAVMHPQTTVSVIAILYGLFALVAGIVLVVSGFATRSVTRQLDQASARVVEL
ncbi:HdeD family acid-resistance protein [Cellulomonas soli]|uniref:HdeD family acid-resistance protein n=1 Tax=Cellulomonas soli TaxID=931535 RepID=UPI003F82EAD9